MYKSFRRFLGLGLLGVMLLTVVPVFGSPQHAGKKAGKKGGKKGGHKPISKGGQKKGGGGSE